VVLVASTRKVTLRETNWGSQQYFEEEICVDIRIGIMNVVRELNLEVADETAAGVRSDVEAAIAAKTGTLWLTDRDGRQVGVPAAQLAYVELGSTSDRRIGFSAE
jgi:hypothetical protein